MGRGTIVGEGGQGLYTVQLDYGVAEKGTRLAVLTQRVTDAQAALDAQETIEQTYAQRLAELLAEQDAAIDALAIAPDAEVAERRRALEQNTGEVLVVRKALDMARIGVTLARGDLLTAERAKTNIQLIDPSPVVSAWCADYTIEAGGAVATVEVPGEPVQTILAPACPAPAAADGKVVMRELMSPEQVFFNAAVLPGWQRHRPTYRVGTLLAKDNMASTATVELDAATSSAQALPINQAEVLTGIPVQYMTCNARAFEIGDRVLVRFDGPGWASPKVIGFESNPRPCEPALYLPITVQAGAWAGSVGTVRVHEIINWSSTCGVWVANTVATYRMDTRNIDMMAGTTYMTAPGESLPVGAVVSITPAVMLSMPQGVDLSPFEKVFNVSQPQSVEYGVTTTKFSVATRVWSSSSITLYGVDGGCNQVGTGDTALAIVGHTVEEPLDSHPPGPATGSPIVDTIFESAVGAQVAEWVAQNCTLPAVTVTIGGVPQPYQLSGAVYDPTMANAWMLRFSRALP